MGTQVKRVWRFIKWVAFAIIVLPFIDKNLVGQAFPVLIVDTAVRNRLAEEWEPTNRFQHEKAYCVTYAVGYRFEWSGPLIVYELTGVTRAYEEDTSPSSIGKMGCPDSKVPWVFAHTHPGTECSSPDESSCEVGGPLANQCFPSQTDMRTLNRSDKPFALIICDEHAITPYWRTAPLPLIGPVPESHR